MARKIIRRDGAAADLMTHYRKAYERAGWRTFPLRLNGKLPLEKGWQTKDYSQYDWRNHFLLGGNLGVLPRPGQVVVDTDPRHNGDMAWELLTADIEMPPEVFTVETGARDGGRHRYFTLPSDEAFGPHAAGYPGIDFQGWGSRFVVGIGSIHPRTGETYRVEPDSHFPLAKTPALPAAIVDLIRLPPRAPRDAAGGELSCAQLAAMLLFLYAPDYGQGGKYADEWVDLMMACHDATDGNGFEEWQEWNERDPKYADMAEVNEVRWNSCTSGDEGGRTYKTLLGAVVRDGGKEGAKAVATLDGNHKRDASKDFMEDEGFE